MDWKFLPTPEPGGLNQLLTHIAPSVHLSECSSVVGNQWWESPVGRGFRVDGPYCAFVGCGAIPQENSPASGLADPATILSYEAGWRNPSNRL